METRFWKATATRTGLPHLEWQLHGRMIPPSRLVELPAPQEAEPRIGLLLLSGRGPLWLYAAAAQPFHAAGATVR